MRGPCEIGRAEVDDTRRRGRLADKIERGAVSSKEGFCRCCGTAALQKCYAAVAQGIVGSARVRLWRALVFRWSFTSLHEIEISRPSVRLRVRNFVVAVDCCTDAE